MLKFIVFYRQITLLLASVLLAFNAHAQTAMVGMTPFGGDEFGVIYQTSAKGANQALIHSFEGISGAFPYYTQLCQASNGKLYGMTSQGGTKQSGVIFEYTISTGAYTRKVEFKGASNGSNPRGSLVAASNGKLYGMTNQGGANNFGVIFEYTPGNDSVVVKFHFDGTNGRNPFGNLMQASNGKLYGMTYQGGTTNDGVLFEYNPANDSFYRRVDLDGANSGRNPFGSLMQASNGLLYALTYQGGSNNLGILFSYNTSSNTLTKLHDFSGTSTGSNPYSTPVQATDGHLYAMTYLGGTNNLGTLFQYNISGNSLVKKLDFNGSGNGRNPFGNLILASNGRLYGEMPYGGSANSGLIFDYNTGSSTYTKLYDFSGGSQGRLPFGSLLQASNQKLYGLSYQGGINNSGVLFEFDPSGNIFTKKVDFGSAINGSNPYGNLMLSNDLKLYGMTYQGGSNNAGVIFTLDPVSKVYSKKVDFIPGSLGKNTYGSLIQASNGKLYGMLYQGGVYDYGTIIEYDPIADTCIKLHDFDGANSGRNPYGDLLQASNGKLYGMTPYGGTDDYGLIFEFDITSKSFQKLHEFNGTDGASPFGSLIQYENGKLYGLTYNGGSADAGVLFEYSISSNTYSNLISFTGTSTGTYPLGTLLEMTDSSLYGMTQFGGNSNAGVVFRFRPNSSVFEKLEEFNGTNGKNPTAQLVKAGNGKLYGKTQYGGNANSGVIFELDLIKDTLVSKVDFNGSNGSLPYGSLLPYCLPQYDTLKVTVCDSFVSPSGRYLWLNSGTFSDTLQAISGCDSILSINLKILRKSFANTRVAVCDSFIAPDGKVYFTPGVKMARLNNYLGCDSIISIDLHILKTDTAFVVKVCDSFKAPDGKVYMQSGDIVAVIPNAAGCDSTMHIRVERLNTESAISVDACRSYTAPDGKIYRQSGNYLAKINNVRGCDSAISIQLTIDTVEVGVVLQDSLLTSVANAATYQWLYCDSNYLPIPGATAKIYKARRNGRYSVAVTQDNCTDTSDCYTVNSLSLGTQTTWAVTMYPNPTDGLFTIRLDDFVKELNVTIRDINGKTVYSTIVYDTKELTLQPALPAGVYSLSLHSSKGEGVFKLIRL
jgi:uncharacterized repeat protein (TIGR03803 family)